MNQVLRRRRRSGCRRTVVLGGAAVATALAMLAPPATADPAGVCPDELVPVPATLVVQGAQKDRNQNGFVCAKYQDGRLVGGPDDVMDDVVL
jgi:hypothetical protein